MNTKKGVSIKDLSKIYISPDKTEFKAVDNISLDIKAGEFVTLLGPSGCGKTTTLRMIAGFEIPTSGEIYLGDEAINNLSPDKRDTGMVFQSYAIFPHLNIYNNIAYGLKIKKLPKDEIDRKVKEIIKLVGLEGMENRAPGQISGGQQQRVALARALVMEPGVLLFDEPLSNLDAKLRLYMRTEIKRIQRKFGITAVYVTHDQAEAMSLSDKIIIMNKGIIEQIGTPSQIYYTPRTKFVANFIGVANFIKIDLVSHRDADTIFSVNGVQFEKPYSGDKDLEVYEGMLRPEAVSLGNEGILSAKVKRSVFMGTMQEYTVELDSGEILEIEIVNPKRKKIYKEGDRVKVSFDIDDLHIF